MGHLSRLALMIGAAGIIAGCGDSASPISGPRAVPQSHAVARHTKHNATSGDLLYITGLPKNVVYVFTYPDGKLVQTLTGFQKPNAECVDASGDVYITQSTGQMVEYAHGGSSPINTFYGAYSYGCAVDPTTGNLAAATGQYVAVWQNGQGSPITYTNPNKYVGERYLSYDGNGNLFIGGDNAFYGDLELSELPAGGSSIVNLTLDGGYGYPGQVQWDGADVAVGFPAGERPWIARFQISGSSASNVGFTKLKLPRNGFGKFWLDGETLVLPFATSPGGPRSFGYWAYPKGAKPTKAVKFRHWLFAAAVSHG